MYGNNFDVISQKQTQMIYFLSGATTQAWHICTSDVLCYMFMSICYLCWPVLSFQLDELKQLGMLSVQYLWYQWVYSVVGQGAQCINAPVISLPILKLHVVPWLLIQALCYFTHLMFASLSIFLYKVCFWWFLTPNENFAWDSIWTKTLRWRHDCLNEYACWQT